MGEIGVSDILIDGGSLILASRSINVEERLFDRLVETPPLRPTANLSGTFSLFVYGTLKRGGCRHRPLEAQRFLGEVHTAPLYRLYDLGSYPGLVRAEDGGVVHGELYEVAHSLVPLLDSLEGVPEWFDLGPVEIVGRAGPIWAYYIMQNPAGGRVVTDGRWEPEYES